MAEPGPVTVTAIGARGDGVAETPAGPVYIPFAAPGDRVDPMARKIVAFGPRRREPDCPHFGRCGGCRLQHIPAKDYSAWLGARISMALAHQGIAHAPIAPPAVSPPGSRRRLALKALKTKEKVILGFNEAASHRLVDIAVCPVADGALTALFTPLRAVLAGLLADGAGAQVTLTLAANGIDALIAGSGEPDLEGREALAAFAEAHDLAALHWSDAGFFDPVAIRRAPVMDFGGVVAPLPPGGFVQATADGERALSDAVLAAVAGAGAVADLFAGLGTFALRLARSSSVHAVEGAKAALDALSHAARRAAGLRPVSAEHRDLFRNPLGPGELARFDAVVFDPPRAGARAQAAEVARSGVGTVVAVSCNPNTFARDARLLIDGGYRLESIAPVGQFLWSHHVELAAVFRRG